MDLKGIIKEAKELYPTHKSDGTELCYNKVRLEAIGWCLTKVKKLNIDDVSQQRELLIDFLKAVRKDKDSITFEQQVDTYLKSINCG